MTDKENLMQEMRPHLQSGLLVTVLEADDYTVFRLADTGYALFLHNLTLKNTQMHIGFNLTGPEFNQIMHHPYTDTFMKINCKAVQQKEERGFVMTADIVEKFTKLRNRVMTMPKNPYINFAIEAKLIEISKKALADRHAKKPGFWGQFRK